jgi:AcrR family transcriptional regulator
MRNVKQLRSHTEPAARPQQARRKEARPAELIDAGLQEFAERGFAGARLEDVARRAGVVKGTIYRYFADKQALFEAAVRSKLPPFMDPLDGIIDDFAGTTQELVTLVVRQMYEEIVDSDLRILMRVILSEGAQFPELTELYYRASVARGRPLLEKIVARGVRRGEIRPDHAPLLPMMIAAPAIMASVWKMTFERFDPIPTQDFLDAHLELLKRGLFIA